MGDNTPVQAPEAQFNALQAIGSSTLNSDGTEVQDTTNSVIEFRAAQDIILSSATGETQVGHFITEEGNATSTTSPLNVDDDPATGLAEGDSELRQIVGSDVIFGNNSNQGSGGTGENGAGNNIVIETASGRTMVGHQSPVSNEWQVEGSRSVTVQLLDGDITVEAGTDAGLDAPDSTVLANAAAALMDETGLGDDLLINGGTGIARIGHNMAGADEGVNNETQRSAGDISVRAGGDLHIIGGQVGHENYDIASIDPTNLNATPESLASGTPIRDRIRGNTTIGAGQNSAAEDSTLIPDVLLIDGATTAVTINSGYGGQGNADVDGELRFFLPAQEGLTIVQGVTFNDSDSNGDAVANGADRTADLGNVFEIDGGEDHEHPFEFFSETAQYDDTIIGPGNYGFYFEAEANNVEDTFTPFIIESNLGSEYYIKFIDPSSEQPTVVNMDGLGDNYIGTGSFELACEEAGLTPEQCQELVFQYEGLTTGVASNVDFSASGGGNENIDLSIEEPIGQADSGQTFGFAVGPFEAQLTGTLSNELRINNALQFEPTSQEAEVVESVQILSSPREVEASFSADIGEQFKDTNVNHEYGEYVDIGEIAVQIEQQFPNALSVASSYQVYQSKL